MRVGNSGVARTGLPGSRLQVSRQDDIDRWQADVVLADGAVAGVRPIRPTDDEALVAFHTGLSADSRYFRFFAPHPRLSAPEVKRFTNVDMIDRVALVVEVDGELAAVGRFDRLPRTTDAEVAFVVADAQQHRGIATVLLEHLAAMARERGITSLTAEVLPTNRAMLGVFAAAGFRNTRAFDDGVVHVEMAISRGSDATIVIAEREHRAEARSVARLLAPSSIAVIGASRRSGTVGNAVITNLTTGAFRGPVYAVNPAASEVAGVTAYPSIRDVPGPVDLAVIAVRPEHALGVVEECGEKGVGGLLVVSAGFAETSTEGGALQRELVRRARFHGMRMIGPNCLGVVNTAPNVSMNATFAAVPVAAGRAGFMAQSGALGVAFLAEAGLVGLGVSTFVSVGNKADVSGNDMLQYWEDDPATAVVLLYLESFGNPRKFARLARRVGRKKPVIALKSGRSSTGRRAARSHTAALASPDSAVDALFAQAGVIRVDTLHEMLDTARVAAGCPTPQGARLAIVGNSGGPAIMAADAASGAGLEIPALTDETQRRLREQLGPNAAVANPVDTTAAADAGLLCEAIVAVLGDPNVDLVVVVFTPTLLASSAELTAALEQLADRTLPVVVAMLATDPLPLQLDVVGIPTFAMPEEAVRSLGRLAAHAAWTRRPSGAVPSLAGIDGLHASEVVSHHLAAHPRGGWLQASETDALLRAYGIPLVASTAVRGAEEAGRAARTFAGPVALKALGPTLLHKSDVGGVRLDLRDASLVVEAYDAMSRTLGDQMTGAVVQPMAGAGVEVIVGVVHDEPFGPLVMFGLGGTAAELLSDRSFRALPLTDLDAAELVRSIRSSPLLFGYRGAPACDVAALEDLLLRVARLAEDVPELAELDLNPVIVTPHGVVVVDARARVTPYLRAPDVRRLPKVAATRDENG
jgi:acetyl coenzyme A synthetase (ADP forming)-like protein